MKQVLGGILLAIGILIAGASGLCSLVMLFGSGGGGIGGIAEMLPLILMFGGIPFAVGVAIAFGGWALLRSARNDRDNETRFE